MVVLCSPASVVVPVIPDRTCGEEGKGPPTGKIMGANANGQFWGAESKSHWYTGVGWGLQPRFHDLKSCSDESDQCALAKQSAGGTLLNKNILCYFALLSEIPYAMLPVGVACSLVSMVEWLGLINFNLYIENKVKK